MIRSEIARVIIIMKQMEQLCTTLFTANNWIYFYTPMISLKFIILEFFCFSVLHVFQFCILNSSVQIGCVLWINVFQFRSFCVLHSKSLFLFFKFAFFRSYFPDLVFFFLRICFLNSSNRLHLHLHLHSLFFRYFSSLRNSSFTWINSSISTLKLESLRLDFVTELEFQRLEILIS